MIDSFTGVLFYAAGCCLVKCRLNELDDSVDHSACRMQKDFRRIVYLYAVKNEEVRSVSTVFQKFFRPTVHSDLITCNLNHLWFCCKSFCSAAVTNLTC